MVDDFERWFVLAYTAYTIFAVVALMYVTENERSRPTR
jgi:hypothetical protein